MPREVRAPLLLCWSDPISGEARSAPVDGALRIGSNWQQNDVVLPLRSVEAFHAEVLFTRSGGWEIVATGSRRLKVGGVMTARAQLKAGTEFAVGPVTFRARAAEASPRRAVTRTGSAPMAARWRAMIAPPPS